MRVNHRAIIPTLIKEARKSLGYNQLGSALIVRGKILAKGHNQTALGLHRQTRPVHAEEHVLYKHGRSFNKNVASIITIRIGRSGGLLSSFPCKHCLDAIKKYRVSYCYYIDENGNLMRQEVGKMVSCYVTKYDLSIGRLRCSSRNLHVFTSHACDAQPEGHLVDRL